MYYFPYRFYIRTEEAKNIVNLQRRMHGVILIAIAVILYIMRTFVYPKLSMLYRSLNTDQSALTQSFPTMSLVLIFGLSILAFYFFITKPDYSKVNKVTKKYKAGEMIRTQELSDNTGQAVLVVIVILTVAYLYASLIAPIYSLTNQY